MSELATVKALRVEYIWPSMAMHYLMFMLVVTFRL